MNNIVMSANELENCLTDEDNAFLKTLEMVYSTLKEPGTALEKAKTKSEKKNAEDDITAISKNIGHLLEEYVKKVPNLHVYSFETPREQHASASRLISKLRSPLTEHDEFLYYIQRAYEMLFTHTFCDQEKILKRSIITKTPVTNPFQAYAAHRIPDIDKQIENSVMCVMLRGALLPSMIVSKEIQEYSSTGYTTPFELFKIKRDESKTEKTMDYLLDLDRSFFRLDEMDGKDLIFADPMNATGGSLIAIIKFLEKNKVKPKSIKFLNVISATKGCLRILRSIKNVEIYTLWLDPLLNEMAYILPGLGDAGDRLNGKDTEGKERNMIKLMADYGTSVVNLYRAQVAEIEKTVFSKGKAKI